MVHFTVYKLSQSQDVQADLLSLHSVLDTALLEAFPMVLCAIRKTRDLFVASRSKFSKS